MDKITSLGEIVEESSLPEESKIQFRDLIAEIAREDSRLKFALQRLKQDKVITEGFLSESIIDLERTTAQLKEYQAKEFAAKDRAILSRETQLQEILDAAPNFISLVDKNFRYQITNKIYSEFFGHSRSSLKNLYIGDVVPEKGLKQVKEKLSEVFQGKSQVYEFSLTNTKGEHLVLSMNLSPATNLEGDVIGAYVFGQDITILKEKENAIKEKNAELESYIQSNLQLENFAYLASHDLRSPLLNVLSFSELLKKSASAKLTDRELQFLHFIISSSKHMQEFIEDLLSFALAKNREIIIIDLDLGKLLKEVQQDLQSTISDTQAQIAIGAVPEYIRGDAVLLKQVFQNLISNAIKFVPSGIKPNLKISCKKDPSYFTFSIQDNGIGIAKKYQQTIFAIFKKLHRHSEYPGTGIGLSTCQDAIEKHGGKIWLESEERSGSTFYFTLPR